MARKARRAGDSFNRTSTDTDELAQNISASEAQGVFLLSRTRFIELTPDFTIVKKPYPPNAFVIDHPIRGDLDNTNFVLNQDYEPDVVLE